MLWDKHPSKARRHIQQVGDFSNDLPTPNELIPISRKKQNTETTQEREREREKANKRKEGERGRYRNRKRNKPADKKGRM